MFIFILRSMYIFILSILLWANNIYKFDVFGACSSTSWTNTYCSVCAIFFAQVEIASERFSHLKTLTFAHIVRNEKYEYWSLIGSGKHTQHCQKKSS